MISSSVLIEAGSDVGEPVVPPGATALKVRALGMSGRTRLVRFGKIIDVDWSSMRPDI